MPGEALPPGSIIGIIGGGQLGRMLAQAAANLGFRTSIFSPIADDPAFEVATFRHQAAYDDRPALEAFARQADAVTFEFENVPVEAIIAVERHTPLSPPRVALEATQDRLAEKRFLASIGLPTAPFVEVAGSDQLPHAYAEMSAKHPGCNSYLKFARFGYDGKGQLKIAPESPLEEALEWLGNNSAVLECEVPFSFELSVLAVRHRSGPIVFYDPPRNTHRGGILHESFVPAPISPAIEEIGQSYVRQIADALDYIGVLAVEMFFIEGGDWPAQLLINEIAPRVHNSGHWTREACAVSQFENHIRAVAGWPLGSTQRHSDARMVNLLGAEATEWQSLLEADPMRSLTLYGKRDARAGRKMGHYVELIIQGR